MRPVVLAVVAAALLIPAAAGAVEQHREATFTMGRGFEDRLTVVSGEMELASPAVSKSAGFFRTTAFTVSGLSRACWQQGAGSPPTCVDGPLRLSVPSGASLGLNSRVPYAVDVEAAHAVVTFVDLSQADGFGERLHVGPSAIASLVDGRVSIPTLPAVGAADQVGFTLLEAGRTMELKDATGQVVRVMRFDDQPLLIEGSPAFPGSFGADVVVLPFEDGASVTFRPATDSAAAEGLSEARMDQLSEILSNVRILSASAKSAPFAILAKAGAVLSEVFNGAFLRTKLADDPNGLGDVSFAKFNELSVSDDGTGRGLDFDGSYTLVVGDLGPSFDKSSVSNESQSLRFWAGLFLLLAVVVVGAWLWLRDGPVGRPEPGPHTWLARIATAVGAVAAFLVWDWQLNEMLGSSVLTTKGSGSALGAVALIEVGSLLLAGLIIGLPVFLCVRYGLAMAKRSKYSALAATAGVFFTVAIGILVMPALVSFLASIAS